MATTTPNHLTCRVGCANPFAKVDDSATAAAAIIAKAAGLRNADVSVMKPATVAVAVCSGTQASNTNTCTVGLSALAVFRFIASSVLVGRMTARSAGFLPSTPESGHRAMQLACPKSANSRRTAFVPYCNLVNRCRPRVELPMPNGPRILRVEIWRLRWSSFSRVSDNSG